MNSRTTVQTKSVARPLHGLDGRVCFTSTDVALLGRPGRRWVSPSSSDRRWADAVMAGLRGDEVAVGALSFEAEQPAVMHRLEDPRRLSVDDLLGDLPQSERAISHQTVEVPTPGVYADAVRTALGHIDRGAVEKVVLGRFLDLESHPPLVPAQVLRRLLATRPGPYVFSVPVPVPVPVPGARDIDDTVLGASPELLVRRRGALVEAMPLAGSVPRSPDSAQDDARRLALAGSEKDLREHSFVVRDIVRRLATAGVDVDPTSAPVVVGTDTLWHLATPIVGRARDGSGCSALHLAQTLSPTPAVGGTPRLAALDLISELEVGPRGYLAGAVGWVDGQGDGEFALTLRSGLLSGGRLRLFAGAGIVAGSDPDSEVRETGAKLATMAAAVGL